MVPVPTYQTFTHINKSIQASSFILKRAAAPHFCGYRNKIMIFIYIFYGVRMATFRYFLNGKVFYTKNYWLMNFKKCKFFLSLVPRQLNVTSYMNSAVIHELALWYGHIQFCHVI